jgi:hypothetical protein
LAFNGKDTRNVSKIVMFIKNKKMKHPQLTLSQLKELVWTNKLLNSNWTTELKTKKNVQSMEMPQLLAFCETMQIPEPIEENPIDNALSEQSGISSFVAKNGNTVQFISLPLIAKKGNTFFFEYLDYGQVTVSNLNGGWFNLCSAFDNNLIAIGDTFDFAFENANSFTCYNHTSLVKLFAEQSLTKAQIESGVIKQGRLLTSLNEHLFKYSETKSEYKDAKASAISAHMLEFMLTYKVAKAQIFALELNDQQKSAEKSYLELKAKFGRKV